MVGTEAQTITHRFGVKIVQTWAGIAEQLGKSERTVRYYAALGDDPLPVQREGRSKVVWITYADLLAWANRRGLGVA
jgi:predicted transcriptional regulator